MKKRIVVLLCCICLLLGMAESYVHMSTDKTSPQIQFPNNEITYVEGSDDRSLLEGVTAKDDKDGDVTDSLLIERIYVNDDSSATVIYVARDKENNIAKVSRTVKYQPDGGNDTADSNLDEEIEEEKNMDQTETSMEVESECPRINLKQNQIEISVGETMDLISYVEDIVDDKDDKEFLWQQIQVIDGDFDSWTEGIYELTYYVVDSDGNKSNEEKLTVTVQ